MMKPDPHSPRRRRSAGVVLAAVALALGWTACGRVGRRVPAAGGRIAPADLRCEYRSDPLGIDSPRPRLSWALASEGRGEAQSAYRILVASSSLLLDTDRGDLWDSGKVRSAESLGIAFAGPALRSGQRCFWKVRVWDGQGRSSAWSPTSVWETALLGERPWQGRFDEWLIGYVR